jgi:hypothetical protein
MEHELHARAREALAREEAERVERQAREAEERRERLEVLEVERRRRERDEALALEGRTLERKARDEALRQRQREHARVEREQILTDQLRGAQIKRERSRLFRARQKTLKRLTPSRGSQQSLPSQESLHTQAVRENVTIVGLTLTLPVMFRMALAHL